MSISDHFIVLMIIQTIIVMNRQYYKVFRAKTLNHHSLKNNISQKFKESDLRELLNFDEILYLLDQQCPSRKSSRDICRELFEQAQNKHYKTTISTLIEKYIQNLETSKLCLLRDEGRLQQLKEKTLSSKKREKAFIYLKIMQVSIFSRFTKDTILQYKIEPTDIPPVRLNNVSNYTLNHEFVLEMQENEFDIIFYESGIEIFRWTFPDQPGLNEGEYTRLVQSDNITFEAKLKYLPKGKQGDVRLLESQIKTLEKQIQTEKRAFHELCCFQPFQHNSEYLKEEKEEYEGVTCREKVLNCMPCFKKYVIVLFWFSILQVLTESWASFYWPAQFLDIMLTIYLLGILYSKQRKTFNFHFLMISLGYFVLLLKSAWEAFGTPRASDEKKGILSLVVCSIGKVILILILFISRGHEETRNQCDLFFLNPNQGNKAEEHQNEILSQNIYEQ